MIQILLTYPLNNVLYIVVVASCKRNQIKYRYQPRDNMCCFAWFPRRIWSNSQLRYALVVLNSDISSADRLIKLWNGAKYRVLVDGAANKWFKLTQETKKDIVDPIPNLVTGDFDSICPNVRKFYEQQGSNCKVICTPDQEFTDFTKALHEISKRLPDSEDISEIYAFTEYGGRLDHIFGLFETLFHANKIKNLPPVFLVSGNTIDWLLPAGKNIINLESESVSDAAVSQTLDADNIHCGIIPIGEPCHQIQTSGLKWNLCERQTLAFGSLVSTSNRIIQDIVTIENHKPLVWTMKG